MKNSEASEETSLPSVSLTALVQRGAAQDRERNVRLSVLRQVHSKALNPKPQNPNPKPHTPHPKPRTLNLVASG